MPYDTPVAPAHRAAGRWTRDRRKHDTHAHVLVSAPRPSPMAGPVGPARDRLVSVASELISSVSSKSSVASI